MEGDAVTQTALEPISGPIAWRGEEIAGSTEWIYHLSSEEIAELEEVGRRFVLDDPDLGSVTAEDYPLPVTAPALRTWGADLDTGRGFVLVRGLQTELLSDAVAGAIFFVLGLHLGEPMKQNQNGDLLDHVVATSSKTLDDAGALPSRVRDKLNFHSDSSDVVALLCLRGARSGGESSLLSSAALYNRILELRPDLAPLLFEPFHWDWKGQDPDAPANTYTSPIVSHVDGTFSMYVGTRTILKAQDYPEVPRLTAEQTALLELLQEVTNEDGLALDMEFQPGDIQWVLNYAGLHSRREFTDWPSMYKRRHLLRLWLKRDVGRPMVDGFGKNVVTGRDGEASAPVADPLRASSIREVVVPNESWGL